jgi:hypothetical protein
MPSEDLDALKQEIVELRRIVDNQAARLFALESYSVCLGRAVKRRYPINDAMAISLIYKATKGDPAGEALADKAVPICQKLIAASLK